MSPEVNESGAFGGDDGLGGYMPLAVAVPTATAGMTELNWVHSDHLGVPIRITDASGMTIAQSSSYTAPAFPGQSRTLVDLYYNKYRDYDPTTGRYIQADPIGLAGDVNPYLYVGGNPVRFTDPQGLETYWEHYTGLPDSYRRNTIDVIAGVSDSATLGATYYIRDFIGANRDVDRCSLYYDGGEWAGLGLGGARLAYAGTVKIGSIMAIDGAAASAFRNTMKGAFRLTFSKATYRIYPYEMLLKKYGTDAAVKAASGRTNLGYNAWGGAAVARDLLNCGCG